MGKQRNSWADTWRMCLESGRPPFDLFLKQPQRFLCALPNLALYVVDGALEPEILKP